VTAVIIPVYNGADVLPLTVPAVLAQQGIDQIIWVDDGSSDATTAMLREATQADARVRVVRLSENRGRSAARNAGVAACDSDTLVFFDADVEPQSDASAALTRALESPGAVASVARFEPVLTEPYEPYQNYAAHFSRGPALGTVATAPIDWRFFLTGACAMRREDLATAGGFREDIAYGEDVALGCALTARAPQGLRLASTCVRLHDVGTLERAVRNAEAYGRGLRNLRADCPSLTARFDRLRVLAPAARALTSVLRRLIDRLPPGETRRRCVRYLLGLSVLRAYPRA